MNTWGIGCFPRKYHGKVPFLLQLCIAHTCNVFISVWILMFIPYILRFWQAFLPLMFPWCPSLYPYLSRWFTYFSKALASLPSWNSRIAVLTNRLGGLVLAWFTWLEQQIGACGWILVFNVYLSQFQEVVVFMMKGGSGAMVRLPQRDLVVMGSSRGNNLSVKAAYIQLCSRPCSSGPLSIPPFSRNKGAALGSPFCVVLW